MSRVSDPSMHNLRMNPGVLWDFFPKLPHFCHISGTSDFLELLFVVHWPENWGFFILLCCIFPTTIPVNRGQVAESQRDKLNRSLPYTFGTKAPLIREESLPVSALSTCRFHCCHCLSAQRHYHKIASELRCKRMKKTRRISQYVKKPLSHSSSQN